MANNNKQQLNESTFQALYDWFVQHASDTSHYVDAYGQSQMTKGEDFLSNIYIFLGLSTAVGVAAAQIKGKLAKIPSLAKNLFNIAKAVKTSKSPEEAKQKIEGMGLKPVHAVESTPTMQEAKQKKIKNVLMILESQVDRKARK